MYKMLLIPILLFSVTGVAVAEPQDVVDDIRQFSGRLSDYVVPASSLVGDRAEAAKVKRNLSEMLELLEKHYRCKATKTVEIDSIKRAITVTFVSKTSPVISFIVVAQNDNLILEQATIGGFRVVNLDPYGLDR
jgi:hypothetical protein